MQKQQKQIKKQNFKALQTKQLKTHKQQTKFKLKSEHQ